MLRVWPRGQQLVELVVCHEGAGHYSGARAACAASSTRRCGPFAGLSWTVAVQRLWGATTTPRVGLPCSTARSRWAATSRCLTAPVATGYRTHSSVAKPIPHPSNGAHPTCATSPRRSGRWTSYTRGTSELPQGTTNTTRGRVTSCVGSVFRYAQTSVVSATGRPSSAKMRGGLRLVWGKNPARSAEGSAGATQGLEGLSAPALVFSASRRSAAPHLGDERGAGRLGRQAWLDRTCAARTTAGPSSPAQPPLA